MGWKDDLQVIVKQNTQLNLLLHGLHGQVVANSKRIEALKAVIEGQMKNQSRSADRMADRMIEMAMVNKGDPIAAASHRRTLQEKEPEGTDLWQDDPNTQWPPPGCDAVRMP